MPRPLPAQTRNSARLRPISSPKNSARASEKPNAKLPTTVYSKKYYKYYAYETQRRNRCGLCGQTCAGLLGWEHGNYCPGDTCYA